MKPILAINLRQVYTQNYLGERKILSHRVLHLQAVPRSVYGADSSEIRVWKANEMNYGLLFFVNYFERI